ncbi:MAG: SIS domain-containing protein [Eubacteriales bacterium]|nr:SIS domain-containing protein [Eubacteriales bacterium]
MNNIESYKEIISIESASIKKLTDSLDYDVMDKILALFCTMKESSHKVIVAGCGTAGTAAKRIAHTLSVVEIPAFYLSPANSIHGGFGAIQKGDVVVLISKSGNTQEIVNYISVSKAKGATTIGVTENEESKLGCGCDIVLKVKVDREPDKWGIISSGSMLAVISVFDAIAFTAMNYNGFNKEQFYLIHSGGGVGDILRKEL